MSTSPVKSNSSTHPPWLASFFTILALVFCATHGAQAATKTSDRGGLTGHWRDTNNWNSIKGLILGHDVHFDNSGQSPLADMNIGANRPINSVTITPTAGENWNLGSDNGAKAFTLTLGDPGSSSVFSSTFKFTGFAPGAVEFALTGNFFEIAPLSAAPESSTWCATALAAAFIGFQMRRRVRAAIRTLIHRLTRSTPLFDHMTSHRSKTFLDAR